MFAFLKSLFLPHVSTPAAAEAPRSRRDEPAALIASRRIRPLVSLDRIYVCHADTVDPRVVTRRVRRICRDLVADGLVPIAPHLYLPTFLDSDEHALALALQFELVGICDELRVYGTTVTAEMRRVIDHATTLGLPVRLMESVS